MESAGLRDEVATQGLPRSSGEGEPGIRAEREISWKILESGAEPGSSDPEKIQDSWLEKMRNIKWSFTRVFAVATDRKGGIQ